MINIIINTLHYIQAAKEPGIGVIVNLCKGVNIT